MWEQCLRADGRRIADIRVTENLMGATHGVRHERLETLHLALGSRRLFAWSRALREVGRKLGFLEGDFDLVAVEERDDGEAWVTSESCCLAGAE
jgi:hypothetical protein